MRLKGMRDREIPIYWRAMFHSLILLALCQCLLFGSGVFPKVKWGVTTPAMKAKFPKGLVEIKPTGETFIVVNTALFGGLHAKTTFSTHPVFGLNVIVSEFPAQSPFPTNSSSAYVRPTTKQAERIKASIVKELTGIYGKPYVKTTDYGSITVWKGKGDIARLNTVVVDSGRTDVRLWLEPSSEGLIPTTTQKQLEAVFNHTDAATWSKGGGMKTKWGMGPADVAEVFPELGVTLPSSYEPRKQFSTDAFIEGNVGIDFFFYKGRLCEVRVGPCLRSGDPIRTSDKDRQEFWDECQRWAEHSREVLREKYGVPFVAPTAERVKEVEAEGEGFHQLEWVWRTKETGLTFVRATVALQMIVYQDISPFGRESLEAEEAFEAAEEADRKAPF